MLAKEKSLDENISNFCSHLLHDYDQIKMSLQTLHPDWSDQDLAKNLMEFGRGQYSGIAEPSEKEIRLIVMYVDSLTFSDKDISFFTAYSGGCIMGLIMTSELTPDQFTPALEISVDFANKHFGSIE